MSEADPRTVLVVDDEAQIRRFLRAGFELDGFAVEEAERGGAALQAATAKSPDLVILDLGLPDMDGHELLRLIRSKSESVPIVVLSSRGDEAGKVQALDLGADDYLTKPFGVRELVARAHALLRRPRQASAAASDEPVEPAVSIHGIEIDPARRRVRVEGREVDLTDQEFRLLHLLATHAGIVFSREALLSKIWRGDTFVTVRSVDTLVKRLRRRIEADPANPKFLLTVWGVGYKFADV
jgi:DNA-binding response OmpR family regulator